jgi:hypothetical protein
VEDSTGDDRVVIIILDTDVARDTRRPALCLPAVPGVGCNPTTGSANGG